MTLAVIGAAGAGKSTIIEALARLAPELACADGLAPATAALLVISGPDGIDGDARDHVAGARAEGIRSIIVFINKLDLIAKDDRELVDLVEMEVRELLLKYKLKGDDATVLRGSASRGDGMAELAQACRAL